MPRGSALSRTALARFDRPWALAITPGGWYIVIGKRQRKPQSRFCARFHRGDAPLPFVDGWQLIMQRDKHSTPIKPTALNGRQLMAVFWPFLQPYRLRIAGAVLSLFLVAGALLTMGRGLAYLVDQGLGKQDPELLDRAVLGTAVIALLLAIGSFLRTTLVNQIGEMVLADVRRALFSHLLKLSVGWFETARTGDVLARITTDTAVVQTVMTSTLSMAARNVILLIGGLVMVVLSSPKMSLVVLFVVPVVVVPLDFHWSKAADRIAPGTGSAC